MLYGDYIDKIRKLPQENKYLIGLKVIEYQHEHGHITDEQVLDKAVDLVLDYCRDSNLCNNSNMNIPIYNCEDSLEIAIKTNYEIRIGNILSSKNYLFRKLDSISDINGNTINAKSTSGKIIKRNEKIIKQYTNFSQIPNSKKIEITDIYIEPRYICLDRKVGGFYISRLLPIFAKLFLEVYDDFQIMGINSIEEKYSHCIKLDRKKESGKYVYVFRTSVKKLAKLLSLIDDDFITYSQLGGQDAVTIQNTVEKICSMTDEDIKLSELVQVCTKANTIIQSIIFSLLKNLQSQYNALEYNENYLLAYKGKNSVNQIFRHTNLDENAIITDLQANTLKDMGLKDMRVLYTKNNGKRVNEFYKRVTSKIAKLFDIPDYELMWYSRQIEIRISNFEPLNDIMNDDKYRNYHEAESLNEVRTKMFETLTNQIRTEAVKTNQNYENKYKSELEKEKAKLLESEDITDYCSESDIEKDATRFAYTEIKKQNVFKHNDLDGHIRKCNKIVAHILNTYT